MFFVPVSSLSKQKTYRQSSSEKNPAILESSPDHVPRNYSEGEVPLLTSAELDSEVPDAIGSNPMSPPFIRAPLEDRSKYEKLNHEEYVSSSDSSLEDTAPTPLDLVKKKRKVKNLPEKLQSVYKTVELPTMMKNLKSERSTKKANKNPSVESTKNAALDSDDSIGSASDLRVDEDVEETSVKADAISETVSESIRTCGSSAYHAECESMATHEDDTSSRMMRLRIRKEMANVGRQQQEDALFVGHQYGEKPLLLDDELDSDSEGNLKLLKTIDEKKELWIQPPNSFEDKEDVFSMAPFSNPKNKKKHEYEDHEREETPISQRGPLFASSTPYKDNDYFARNDREASPELLKINQSLNPFLNCEYNSEFIPNTLLYSTTDTNILNIETPVRDNYFESTCFPSVVDQPQEYFYAQFEKPKQAKTYTTAEFQFSRQLCHVHTENSQSTNIPDTDTENKTYQPPIYSSTDVYPTYNHKRDKKKEGKTKYYLIEDRGSDESPQVVHRVGKVSKGNSNKKASGKNKKSKQAPAAASIGFSNMSFEDFPSDEDDIERDMSSVMPFEVVRCTEEKKGASLKRKSNPFS